MRNRQVLAIGDHVLIGINKSIDRSSTCPRSFEAEALDVVNSSTHVKLGSNAGRIDTLFPQVDLLKVTGRKRKLNIPDVDVSLIKAARFKTSYTAQNKASTSKKENTVCNCRVTIGGGVGSTVKHCLDKAKCSCWKIKIPCGTKCHKGFQCNYKR